MIAIKQPTIQGFTLPILVYESVDEATKASGKETVEFAGVQLNPVLAECNKNLVYRGTLVDGRNLVASVVEKVTGVAREYRPVMKKVKVKDENGVEVEKEEQKKDRDGDPLTEPLLDNDDYVKAALAKSGKTAQDIQPEVDKAASEFVYTDSDDKEIARGLQVDIKERERKTKPPVLAGKYSEKAKELLAAPAKLANFTKLYQKLFAKPLEADTQSNPTKLGWALRDFLIEREKQAMAAI